MLDKRFLLAWLLAFIIWFGGAYVVNVMIIDYSPIMNLFRPWEDELKLFPILIVVDLALTCAIVWLYSRIVEPRPWPTQGLQFGLAVAVLTPISMYTRSYVAQPVPQPLLLQQVLLFTLLTVVIGLTVAYVYRNGRATGSTSMQ